MAKIVKSTTGYWVAKETRPSNSYWPAHDEEWFKAEVSEISKEEAKAEASQVFGVSFSESTPERVVKKLIDELPHVSNGTTFAFDGYAPSGIVKVIEEK